MMDGDARRIQVLRERSGRSHAELAALVGINLAAYHDLEHHDDELESAISLGDADRLAAAFGVTLPELLVGPPERASENAKAITLTDLAIRLQGEISKHGLDAVEDQVGWRLSRFVAEPTSVWGEPLDFLKNVCAFIQSDWRHALPARDTSGSGSST